MIFNRTSQGWLVAKRVDGFLVKVHYIGYTRREARSMFMEYVKKVEKEGVVIR